MLLGSYIALPCVVLCAVTNIQGRRGGAGKVGGVHEEARVINVESG